MAVHFVAIVRAYLQLGAYARTTATATKTPENNDLIGWLRHATLPQRCVTLKKKTAAKETSAARALVQFFDVVCQMTKWNFQI